LNRYLMPEIYQKKIIELENVEERVVWLLNRKEHLRNCDKCLIFYYWKHVDGLNNIGYDTIHALTTAETITRCRRHVQNDLALFLPTEVDVITARSICEDAVRDWAIHNKKLMGEE
jgi:hypothetical protein